MGSCTNAAATRGAEAAGGARAPSGASRICLGRPRCALNSAAERSLHSVRPSHFTDRPLGLRRSSLRIVLERRGPGVPGQPWRFARVRTTVTGQFQRVIRPAGRSGGVRWTFVDGSSIRGQLSILMIVMGITGQPPRDNESAHAEGGSSSGPVFAGQGRGQTTDVGWHPGVRFILVLVVVLPILATGVFTGSGVASGWSFRQHAQVVANDATQLQTVASARAQMNPLSVPLTAVSYAAQLGISEPVLDTLLKPAVPFSVQLAQET